MNSASIAPNTVLDAGKLPAEFLARLLSDYGSTPDPTVIVPPRPGYDAAVVRPPGNIIVKSDPITFATSSPATYLVAVNANDIACLGGVPRWITVTALIPEGSTAREVESLFHELSLACSSNGIAIIGGHTEVTPGISRILLSATMIGAEGPNGILTPGEAKSNDDLYLTKTAGIEGTSILATELPTEAMTGVSRSVIDTAIRFIHDPGISVVDEARLAHSIYGVTAMHDPTEGGVATAIHELADASSLGVEVSLDHIPVADATREICDALNISPYGLLSSGALLFTASAAARGPLESTFSNAVVPLARIGRMHSDPNRRVADSSGTQVALPRYDADEITRAFANFAQE